MITKVDPNGLAFENGLRRGMLVLKVGNMPVTSAAKAREMLQNSSLEKGVLLQVQTLEGGKARIALKSETADK